MSDKTKITAYNKPIGGEGVECLIDSGQSVADAFPELSSQVAVNVNGRLVPQEEYKDCIFSSDDTVTMVRMPAGDGEGSGKNIARSVALLAVTIGAAVISGGALAPLGVSALAGSAIGAGVAIGGSLLVNTLIPPPDIRNSDGPGGSFTRRGALTGSRNQLAPYAPIPRVYGHMRMFPPMAAKPYTEIVGNQQYLRLLFNCGPGPLELSNPKIGDTAIGSFDELNNFTSNGTYESIQIDVAETPGFYTTDIKEENPGVTLAQKNDEMIRTTGPDADSVSFDLTFPQGLFQIDSNSGDITPRSVEFDLYYRPTGSGDSFVRLLNPDTVRLDNFTATSDAKETYRAGAKIDFPERGQYDVRIRRITPARFVTINSDSEPTQRTNGEPLQTGDKWIDTDDNNKERYYLDEDFTGDGLPAGFYETDNITLDVIFDSAVVTAFRTISDRAPTDLPGTVQIGMRIKATDQLNGILDEFNVEAKSRLAYYDGNNWDVPIFNSFTGSGSGGKVTSNPAWVLADLFAGEGNQQAVDFDMLDADAFKYWADTFGEDFQYNSVIDSSATVQQLANNIAAAGRASWGVQDGQYRPILDESGQSPIQMFTPRNSSSFSASKTFPDELHGLKMKFRNKDNGWKEDEAIVYQDGYSKDGTDCRFGDGSGNCKVATKFTEVQLDGVTSWDQAWRLGRYKLAERILRPEVFTYKADIEQLRCQRGDVVFMASDVTLWGSTWGRLKEVQRNGSNEVTQLVLDQPVIMGAGKDYNIRIREEDGGYSLLSVQTQESETDIIAIDSPAVAAINEGDLFTFGEDGKETVPLKIINIRPGNNLTATLTLVDRADGIHDADQGAIPAYNSNITEPTAFDNTTPPVPIIDSVRSDDNSLYKDEDGTFRLRMLVSFSIRPGNPTTEVEARYRPAGSSEGWVGLFKADANLGVVSLPDVARGKNYIIQLRSRYNNNVSGWVQFGADHQVQGKNERPPNVTGFTAAIDKAFIRLSWDQVAATDIEQYEIRLGTDWATALPVKMIKATQTTDKITTDGLLRYFIKAIDTSGNYSQAAAQATVVVDTKYLDELAFQNDLTDYVNSTVYNQQVNDLQSQIDGQIESYFQDYDPATDNPPAAGWVAEGTEARHRNDTFTNSDSGESWRWVNTAPEGWHWQQIADTATQQALQKALNAQDTADGKRRVFVTQPVPPYDIGDLWTQGSGGDLLRSTVHKIQGDNYNPSDWVLATKYTDDARAIHAEDQAKDDLAFRLGYDNYADLEGDARAQQPIFEGGIFRTTLVDAQAVLARAGYFSDSVSVGEDGNVLIDPDRTTFQGADIVGGSEYTYTQQTLIQNSNLDSNPSWYSASTGFTAQADGVLVFKMDAEIARNVDDGCFAPISFGISEEQGGVFQPILTDSDSFDEFDFVVGELTATKSINVKVSVTAGSKYRLRFQAYSNFGNIDSLKITPSRKEVEPKIYVTDRDIILATSDNELRSLSASLGSLSGGGGSIQTVSDWNSLVNNPFDSKSPSDFATAGHSHLEYYIEGDDIPFDLPDVGDGNLGRQITLQGKPAVAIKQFGSDPHLWGLAFYTHPSPTGGDPSELAMEMNNLGDAYFKNSLYEQGSRVWTTGSLPNPIQQGDNATFNTLDVVDDTALQGALTVNLDVNLKDTVYVNRGINGGYGSTSETSNGWGGQIWSMIASGGASGPNYNPRSNQYGLAWLRGSNTSADSFADEGVYLYRNGVNYASFGFRGTKINTDLQVTGKTTVDFLEANTLKVDLFKKNTIRAMGGEFLFNDSTKIKEGPAGDRIYWEEPMFAVGDTVVVSNNSADGTVQKAWLKLTGEGDFRGDSARTDTIAGDFSGAVKEGATIAKVSGDLIYVNANDDAVGAPYMQGYKDIVEYNDGPFGGSPKTPAWEISGAGIFANAGRISGFDIANETLQRSGDGQSHLKLIGSNKPEIELRSESGEEVLHIGGSYTLDGQADVRYANNSFSGGGYPTSGQVSTGQSQSGTHTRAVANALVDDKRVVSFSASVSSSGAILADPDASAQASAFVRIRFKTSGGDILEEYTALAGGSIQGGSSSGSTFQDADQLNISQIIPSGTDEIEAHYNINTTTVGQANANASFNLDEAFVFIGSTEFISPLGFNMTNQDSVYQQKNRIKADRDKGQFTAKSYVIEGDNSGVKCELEISSGNFRIRDRNGNIVFEQGI